MPQRRVAPSATASKAQEIAACGAVNRVHELRQRHRQGNGRRRPPRLLDADSWTLRCCAGFFELAWHWHCLGGLVVCLDARSLSASFFCGDEHHVCWLWPRDHLASLPSAPATRSYCGHSLSFHTFPRDEAQPSWWTSGGLGILLRPVRVHSLEGEGEGGRVGVRDLSKNHTQTAGCFRQ